MQFGGFLVEFDAVFAQGLHVDLHTKVFHLGEDGQQGAFNAVEDVLLLLQFETHLGGELPGHIGIFSSIVGHLAGIFCCDIGHGGLAEEIVFLSANERGDGHRGVVQVRFREVIHAMALIGIDQRMREHGIEIGSGDFNAMREQHTEVELEIVADLLDACADEEGAKFFEHRLRGCLLAWKEHEPACMRLP